MKFFVTALTSWDEIPRARHQVTEELLRAGHEVVFVEKNQTGRFAIKTRLEKPRLTIVTPFCPVDYRIRCRAPLINEAYQNWFFPLLQKTHGTTTVINFDFTANQLHRFFPENIYYCNDDHIGACRHSFLPIKRYPTMAERQMAKQASFCVSTSGYLTGKLSAYNRKVYEIPLGGPPPQITAEHRSFRKKPTITVGLLGTLHADHLSVDIINRVLQEPDFRLILIGNNGERFQQKLDHPERALFRGVLTGPQLFKEMRQFDVAVAPYNLEKINKGVSPNKLFQYLACACPVVISAIPNIQGILYPQGTVYIADNDQEFAARIRQAYSEDCPDFADARLDYASKNTWEKRVQHLLFHLKENDLLE